MSKRLCLSLAIASCAFSNAVAQEETPPAATESRAAIVVRAESTGDGDEIQMIDVTTSDVGGGQFFSFSAGPGGAFSFGGNPTEASEFLLNDPAVQKDLELLDAQREQIQQMQQEFGKEFKSQIDSVMKEGGPGKDRMHEVIQEINKRKKARLAEILLPHQIDRLKQISFQRNVNNTGLGQALASKALAEELGIDEEQQAALKKKAEELSKEFEEKVAKIKEEMRDELMSELKPEQRAKVKELMGQKFEFQNPSGPMMLGPRSLRRAAPPPGN